MNSKYSFQFKVKTELLNKNRLQFDLWKYIITK